MLHGLRDFVQTLLQPGAPARDEQVDVRLAAAVLLVEVMRADRELGEQEGARARDLLQRRLGVPEAEIEGLLALSVQKSRSANDYFAFTSVLNERFTQAEKTALVEYMWQVAFADGDADAGEHHVISKVAGLLHVTHGEYIAAKLRARRADGAAPAADQNTPSSSARTAT